MSKPSTGYTEDEYWAFLLRQANKRDKAWSYDYNSEIPRDTGLKWLRESFYWCETLEGHDFWAYVYDRLCHISGSGGKK